MTHTFTIKIDCGNAAFTDVNGNDVGRLEDGHYGLKEV